MDNQETEDEYISFKLLVPIMGYHKAEKLKIAKSVTVSEKTAFLIKRLIEEQPDVCTLIADCLQDRYCNKHIFSYVLFQTLPGHTDFVPELDYDATTDTLYSGSEDTTFKIWKDISTTPKCTYTSPSDVGRSIPLVYDSKKRTLFSGSNETVIKRWKDTNTNPVCTDIPNNNQCVTALFHDATTDMLFCGSSDNTINIWKDPSTNPLCIHTLMGHTKEVVKLIYDTTNDVLLSGSGDKTIKVWKNAITNPTCIQTLNEHKKTIIAIAYDRNTQTVFSGSWDKTIKVWKDALTNPVCIHTLTDHTDEITALAYDENTDLLFSASSDKSIKIWKKARTNPVCSHTIMQSSYIRTLAYDPTKHIVCSSNERIRIWRPTIPFYKPQATDLLALLAINESKSLHK